VSRGVFHFHVFGKNSAAVLFIIYLTEKKCSNNVRPVFDEAAVDNARGVKGEASSSQGYRVAQIKL